MEPDIDLPPGDNWPGDLTPEKQEFVLSRWREVPVVLREEIVAL